MASLSFRRCPYEEGTESNLFISLTLDGLFVSDAVPMKRELEIVVKSILKSRKKCFRRCPYEEGTESGLAIQDQLF